MLLHNPTSGPVEPRAAAGEDERAAAEGALRVCIATPPSPLQTSVPPNHMIPPAHGHHTTTTAGRSNGSTATTTIITITINMPPPPPPPPLPPPLRVWNLWHGTVIFEIWELGLWD